MSLEFLQKNYQKGDPLPPRTDLNLLRVYNFQLCPYAERVLLVLEAKGVPYETINVNLKNKPEFLYEKHPQAKVPAIEFGADNKLLVESLVIADYLDDLYPNKRPLRPKDPYQRAQDRLFVDVFAEFSSSFAKVFFSKEELPDIWKSLSEALKKIESQLSKRRTQKFLSGDSEPGMLDYMVWPWVERIPSGIAFLSNSDPNKYLQKELPTLWSYRNEMLKDKAVAKLVTDGETYKKYYEHVRNAVINSK